ncbi:MAG TPA: DUF6541 family protein, partial [Pseudonocardia sp.]|nr:DUF6541 family protein [Pseudonocardia sp.]
MSWSSALPAALAALAWVLLPGLAATTVAGLRGVAAWAAAPLVSIGVVAGTAVAAEMVGLPWSPPVALGGAAVLVGVAAAVRFLRRGSGVAGSDGPGPPLAVLAGAAGAVCLTVLTAVRAIPTPGTLSQTYDAVFHYNAVAAIMASGRGSSLTVGELTDPAADGAFYPAAWHDLVALVVQTTGAPVPMATNVVALVVAGVVWPLSCLLLVREVAGPRAAACLAAPLVAVGFIAFPWSLMSFGVLWPNLIGLALVPAALAAVVAVCGLARDSALGNAHAVQLLVVGAVAIGLGHPGAAFSLAVLSVAPLLWWLAARLRTLVSAGRVLLTAVTAAVPVVLAVGATAVVTSPLFDGVRSFDWPAYQLPSQAAGEVLLNATNGKDAAWAISAVVVVGAFAATRERTWRWLLPAHLASAMLFVLASSLETPLAATLTGLWYNDSFRLAAMVPVTGVPLAVLGLLAI